MSISTARRTQRIDLRATPRQETLIRKRPPRQTAPSASSSCPQQRSKLNASLPTAAGSP